MDGGYPEYNLTKEEILAAIVKKYPTIKSYLTNVTWDRTDNGWAPCFNDAPNNILEELNKALNS